MKNVFLGVGAIVSGDAFFGYHKECQDLYNKLTGETLFRCDCRGLNRVGKTSLMKKTVKELEQYYADKRALVIDLDMALFANSDMFWEKLALAIRKKLDSKGLLTDDLMRILQPEDFVNETQEIVDALQDEDIRIILLIDEFDQAQEIFLEDDFQRLRHFAQSDIDYGGFSIVLFHRLSLVYIEKKLKVGSVSVLSGVITEKLVLKGFSESDMEIYWQQFDNQLTDIQKEEIRYYCNNLPYGLGLFGREIINRAEQGISMESIDIRDVYQTISKSIYAWFSQRIIALLEKEEMIGDMIEFIIAGRDASLTHNLVNLSDEIKFEGFWEKGNDFVISEFFTSILRMYYMKNRGVHRSDLELLEDKMRGILLTEMRNLPKDTEVEPGTLWHVFRIRGGVQGQIEPLYKNKHYQKMIEDNSRFWGVEYHLEDVLSFNDIYDIYRYPENWEILSLHVPAGMRVFEIWQDKMWCCVLARNALSHGSREKIPLEKRGHVRDYCFEISNAFTEDRQ